MVCMWSMRIKSTIISWGSLLILTLSLSSRLDLLQLDSFIHDHGKEEKACKKDPLLLTPWRHGWSIISVPFLSPFVQKIGRGNRCDPSSSLRLTFNYNCLSVYFHTKPTQRTHTRFNWNGWSRLVGSKLVGWLVPLLYVYNILSSRSNNLLYSMFLHSSLITAKTKGGSSERRVLVLDRFLITSLPRSLSFFLQSFTNFVLLLQSMRLSFHESTIFPYPVVVYISSSLSGGRNLSTERNITTS
jgi:hypothetical protein